MDEDHEQADRLDWRRPGLSTRSRLVMLAVAEAMLADEDASGELVAPRREVCERGVDALDLAVGGSSARNLRRGFAFLTFAVEVLPLFIIGAFSRMSRLSLARRVHFLEALETSRVGLLAMLFVALKVPLCIPAFEDPELLASTSFDRPSTTSRRKPLPIAKTAPTEVST